MWIIYTIIYTKINLKIPFKNLNQRIVIELVELDL